MASSNVRAEAWGWRHASKPVSMLNFLSGRHCTPIANAGLRRNPLKRMYELHAIENWKFRALDIAILLLHNRWNVLMSFLDIVDVPEKVLRDGMHLYVISVPLVKRNAAVTGVYVAFGIVV